jgi:hypothetical protein
MYSGKIAVPPGGGGIVKQCIHNTIHNTEILITEMGVLDEAKNVIPLKFLRKIKNFFSLL